MINLSQLKEVSIATRYPKNTVIIREGDKDSLNMYIILQGEVRVVKNYGKIDQIVITQLGPGSFFGEMSLFLSKPRVASVITSDEAVILEITEDNIYEVFEKNPELLYGIIKTLCSRIDYLNEKVPAKYAQGMLN